MAQETKISKINRSEDENEKEENFLKFVEENEKNEEDGEQFNELELPVPKKKNMEKSSMKNIEKSSSKATLNSASVQKGVASNVVYLGRIPHGFYEQEMTSYFSQFGGITALRLARNKKSGASKHYAFIQFDSCSVAAIVVETMHNYLLSNRLLQCCLVPVEKVHPDLFKGADQKYKALPWNKIERQRHNKLKTPGEHARQVTKLSKRHAKKAQLIKDLGLEYDPLSPDGLVAPTADTVVEKSIVKKSEDVVVVAEKKKRSEKKIGGAAAVKINKKKQAKVGKKVAA